MANGEADFDLYPYNPCAVPAYIFVVLFGIGVVVHVGYMFWLRSWYFIPFILGCIGESFGYYARLQSHDHIRVGRWYLVQLMLILSSAPLISASIYMTLSRLIRVLHAEDYSFIRTSWISKIYVVIDIGSFICQLFGTAVQASGDIEGIKLGVNVVIGGLAFQMLAFICFVALAATIHTRLNRRPTKISNDHRLGWRSHMLALYATSTLILVRSLFRLVEFAEGSDGVLRKTEALLYVFDASFMSVAVAIFACVHPGQLIKRAHSIDRHRSLNDEHTNILMGGV